MSAWSVNKRYYFFLFYKPKQLVKSMIKLDYIYTHVLISWPFSPETPDITGLKVPLHEIYCNSVLHAINMEDIIFTEIIILVFFIILGIHS